MGRLRNAAWRVRDFFRRDAVLAIACVLAAASCVAVPPDAGYADYVDWRTIGLLFSLMVATSGLARAGVLARACRALVRAGKSGDIPAHIKDAHYGGAAKLGRGLTYQYPHSYPNHWVEQDYLPAELSGAKYYEFGPNKTEQTAKMYWDRVKGRK